MSPFPSNQESKASFKSTGEQDSGAEPDFPMVNNGRGKLDLSYGLRFSRTPAILYWRKWREI